MFDPTYVQEGSELVQAYKLGTGNTVQYRARNIHNERTGVHAWVTIAVNQVAYAWSTFNVERDEERVRLANSAYTSWQPGELDSAEWPKVQMKKALDVFCYGLWDHVVGSEMGELMQGDESIGPPQLLLGSYIVKGGGTILFAPPGWGKSYTALAWAVSLTHGVDRIWSITDTRQTLYVNLERSRDSLRYRLARVNRALGLPSDQPLAFLNARGKSLTDVQEAVARTMEQYSCDCIILDSISRAGAGDLTQNAPANRVIDILNDLAETWVALGHTPRQDPSHVYGAIQFDAGEDIGVQLTSQTSADGTTTGIGLRVAKGNDLPTGQLGIHAIDWDERGLAGIRKAGLSEFPELASGQKQNITELARSYLLLVGKATAGQLAGELGKDRTDISRALTASPDFGKERRGHQVLFYVKAPAASARETWNAVAGRMEARAGE